MEKEFIEIVKGLIREDFDNLEDLIKEIDKHARWY